MEILLVASVAVGGAIFAAGLAGMHTYFGWFAALENDFREKLRRLRISTRKLRAWLIAWLILVLAVFVLVGILSNMLFIGFTLSVLLVCLPWYLVRRAAERRKEKIEDQLADSMVALSNSIKAGLSLPQAIEILAQQTPRPICQEFQQMHGEYLLGKPMEQCLLETKQRLKSENFGLFAAAMEASRESGGRLNETVDRIAHSVRELQRLERKVQSETAQARSSAVYMAIAPAAILAMYYFLVDQENTERLFTTVPGQLMLCAAIVLNLVAYLWARAILNPDI